MKQRAPDPRETSAEHSPFRRFAHAVSCYAGGPTAFAMALATVILWALLGPAFRFSDTWQLVINTGTTIVTFLMVFPIQSTQNRDAKAMQLKLDELIRADGHARNSMLVLEELDDEKLEELELEFHRLRAKRERIESSRMRTRGTAFEPTQRSRR